MNETINRLILVMMVLIGTLPSFLSSPMTSFAVTLWGLYEARHLRVSLSMASDLVRFQSRALRYLFRDVSNLQ